MAKLTDYELDKQAAKDAVATFVLVQSRDWRRRRMNEVWPAVEMAFDLAIASGDSVDVSALLKQVFEGKLLAEVK